MEAYMIFSYKKLLYIICIGIGLSTCVIVPMSSRVLRRGSVLMARTTNPSLVRRLLPASVRLKVLNKLAARRAPLAPTGIFQATPNLNNNSARTIAKSKPVVELTSAATTFSRESQRDAQALKRWLDLQIMRQKQAAMTQGTGLYSSKYYKQPSFVDLSRVYEPSMPVAYSLDQPLSGQALAAGSASLFATGVVVAAPETVTLPGLAGKFIRASENHKKGFEKSPIVLEPQSLALTAPEAQKASVEVPENMQQEKISDTPVFNATHDAHTASPENASDAHKNSQNIFDASSQANQKNNNSGNNGQMPPKVSLARNIGGTSLSGDDDVVVQDTHDIRSQLIPEIEPIVPIPDTPEEDAPMAAQPTHASRLPLVQPALPISDEESAIKSYGNLILQALAAQTFLPLAWAGNSSTLKAMFIAYNNELAHYRKKNNRFCYQLYLGTNERIYRVVDTEWQRILKQQL